MGCRSCVALCLLAALLAAAVCVDAQPWRGRRHRGRLSSVHAFRHARASRSGNKNQNQLHGVTSATKKRASPSAAKNRASPEKLLDPSAAGSIAEPVIKVTTQAQATAKPSVRDTKIAAAPKCPKGRYLDGDACVDCEDYAPSDGYICGKECRPPKECRNLVCPAGSYRKDSSSDCELCERGTYSKGGLVWECTECPGRRHTKQEGATSVEQCVCPKGVTGPNCNECGGDTVVMENGKCGCKAGTGGASCTPCEPGFWSYGGVPDNPFPKCDTCGPHLTSPPGAAAPEYCECEAGYGADRTDVPMEERTCVPCQFGTFNPGQVATQGHSYGELAVGVAAISPMMVRRRVEGAPQILACQECSARNPDGGFTTTELGSRFSKQCICRPGFGGFDCAPCEEGTFSRGGKDAVCHSCPNNGAGFTTVPKVGAASSSACHCRGGYGLREDGTCKRCPADHYSDGASKEECSACPFGTTSAPGASSIEQCREVAQLCPVGQTAPKDAVSKKECGCYQGYGSGSQDPDAPCTLCPPGTYSSGGDLEACRPCRFGYTSPAGAVSVEQCVPVDVCPPGTELGPESAGASASDCRCKRGYGTSTGVAPCHICPVGTYSEGGTYEECKPCPFATTSDFGSTDRDECRPFAQTCPVGQIAPPGAVSRDECGCIPGYGGGKTRTDACSLCPAGTFASGGDTQPCQPCRFGYTSPVGATSEAQCYPTNACPAGTEIREGLEEEAASVSDCVCKAGFGSLSGSGACHLCPAGTYSMGGSMEECRPCPFGTTSAAGAYSKDQCLTSPQACPIGQWAPEGAVSKDQCVCYPGHGAGDSPSDPCTLCKPGSFASGDALDKCMPCGFGFTSPAGATSEHDCRPANQCPAGTALFGESPEYEDDLPVTAESCLCKPGHGTPTGTAPCHLCPSGTFSTGGSLEDCLPCPFGTTTAPGAITIEACMKVAQECPPGQMAPLYAVSTEQCSCLPGHGSVGVTPKDACRVCPAGTFSAGGTTEPCQPCGFGYTSPEGSTSRGACYPTNACPVGTEVHRGLLRADSLSSCVCKPGFGAAPGKGHCRLCPKDTYAYGGDWDECEFCPFGTTSPPGAQGKEECVPATQPCPIGQMAPPGAVSPDQCGCLPGFGGGEKPTDACHICPAGSWSPGGTTDRCIPCRFGYVSLEGSVDAGDCYQVDMCPAGTEYRDSADTAFSLSDCVCKRGHGSQTGSGICRVCPEGTFSTGGTMEDCKECPFGHTSPEGSESFMDCRPVAQPCPIGQWAPEDAVSAEECQCYSGFGGGERPSDPCAMCPAGTFSVNRGAERCVPCPHGYTSLPGSDSLIDCHRDDTCPAGTEEVTGYDGLKSCKCKAGYGSLTGTGACRLCPVGTYAEGGSMEDCTPCPFGHTSRAGADTVDECQRIAQPCPIGQIAPPFAVSAEQCACMPGFGGGEKPTDACSICPAGTWSPGGTTQRCIPCGFAYTSPEGSATQDACVEINACSIGSIYQDGVEKAFSIKDCVCRPGYGVHEDGFCRLCKPGTYAEGGTMDLCKSCGVGWLSEEGSVSWHDCFQEIDVPGYRLGGPAHSAKTEKMLGGPGLGAKTEKMLGGPGPGAKTEKMAPRKPIGAALQQDAQNGTLAAAQKAV